MTFSSVNFFLCIKLSRLILVNTATIILCTLPQLSIISSVSISASWFFFFFDSIISINELKRDITFMKMCTPASISFLDNFNLSLFVISLCSKSNFSIRFCSLDILRIWMTNDILEYTISTWLYVSPSCNEDHMFKIACIPHTCIFQGCNNSQFETWVLLRMNDVINKALSNTLT